MQDILLYGVTQSDESARLMQWAQTTPELHEFVPDQHRLVLERWIWEHRDRLGRDILDVGVDNPRRWLGEGYRTLNLDGSADLQGDLLALPLEAASLDGFVLTEVLEHCVDPFAAMREVYRVLKPGGLLLVTSPFIWPWHGTDDYNDYWRFTAQGWKLLLKEFHDVTIQAVPWTPEGAQLYDFLRRFECMGHADLTMATTGYLCEARR